MRKLRSAGALSVLPGRPVLIAEADLCAYLDTIKVRARAPAAPDLAQPPSLEEEEAARARARRKFVKRKLAGASHCDAGRA